MHFPGSSDPLTPATVTAVSKAIDHLFEYFDALALPATRSFGKGLAEYVDRWREKNRHKFGDDLRAAYDKRPFRPEDIHPGFLLQAVDSATLEDDDFLRQKWAALIANAGAENGKKYQRKLFIQILDQLSNREIRMLEWIRSESIKRVRMKPDLFSNELESGQPVSHINLENETWSMITLCEWENSGGSDNDPGKTENDFFFRQSAQIPRAVFREVSLAVHNLMRLGLLLPNYQSDPSLLSALEDLHERDFESSFGPGRDCVNVQISSYSITQLGLELIEACGGESA